MYSASINGKIAKARIEGVDASVKDLVEVCRNIKGMKAIDALHFLKDVMQAKKPVRYFSHNKKLGHRRELGGKKGRYPKKAASIVYDVLENALSNATYKGYAEELMVVAHAAANKKARYPRLQPKGRRTRHDYVTARVEIILKQLEDKKLEAKKSKESKKEALKNEAASKNKENKALINAEKKALKAEAKEEAKALKKETKNTKDNIKEDETNGNEKH